MSATPPVLRPLPPRPSLEFERKEAKALLRRLRTGDRDALARACSRHPAMHLTAEWQPKLADAQLILAREYGFASWPRLARYFELAERLLLRTPSAVNPGLWLPEAYEESVQQFVTKHQRRATSAARSLISYVPRFEGMSADDVFDRAITEDEARLALARGNGYPSWDVFMERVRAAANERTQFSGLENAPWRRAFDLMQTGDLSQLQALVRKYPDLLHPTEYEVATTMHILRLAVDRDRIDVEQGVGRDRMRPILDWLVSQGFDLQRELDIRLCGDMRMTPADVQYWIDRGANPNWVAPNGYSVLEHAIVRYSNPDAIDYLAQYATVRQPALWIAAGLGDIEGVGRFLDKNGLPTAAAREPRPQFDAIGTRAFGRASDDAAEILMEAAIVAFLNERTGVMEYLVSRGMPVNTLRWDMPFVVMAVGNNKVKMVETLVRCGADLDLRGAYNGSAREMARDMLQSQPPNADRRRIAELCGLNADEILATR